MANKAINSRQLNPITMFSGPDAFIVLDSQIPPSGVKDTIVNKTKLINVFIDLFILNVISALHLPYMHER